MLSSVLFKDLPLNLPPGVQIPLLAALCAGAVVLLFMREGSPIRRLAGVPLALLGALLLSLLLPVALALARLTSDVLGAMIVGAAATTICVTAVVATYGTHWSWALVGTGLLVSGASFGYMIVVGRPKLWAVDAAWALFLLVAGVALLMRRSSVASDDLVPTPSARLYARVLTGLAWMLPSLVYALLGILLVAGALLVPAPDVSLVVWGLPIACVGVAGLLNGIAAVSRRMRLRAIAYVGLGVGIAANVVFAVFLVTGEGVEPAFAEAIPLLGMMSPALLAVSGGFTSVGLLFLRARSPRESARSHGRAWLRYWVTPRKRLSDSGAGGRSGAAEGEGKD